MVMVNIAWTSLKVSRAGEDGVDMDAEWRLDLVEETGGQTANVFTFSANNVVPAFNGNAPEGQGFFPLGAIATQTLEVGDELNLRASGRELDAGIPNEELPGFSFDVDVGGGTGVTLPLNFFASTADFSYYFVGEYTIL